MENMKERIIVVNSEPDFVPNDNSDILANYIILCENEGDDQSKEIYNSKVCGITIAKWVAMACESKPIFLNVSSEENILDLLRPYANEKEYIVVLYANTPLITKTHLKDLLGYVSRKRFNACKLKRGYIIKSEYVLDADALYSNFAYDLSTNDFFEVKTISDVEMVRLSLEKRMFSYHLKNGVSFDNQNSTIIDATIKIGSDSIIGSGATIINNSTIGNNVTIGTNVIIDNSIIGDNCEIKSGAIVKNSIVKEDSQIFESACIVHSVIGENTKVGIKSNIIDTAIESGAILGNFVNVDTASILNGAEIGKFSNIAGIGVTVVIEENAKLEAFSNVVKTDNEN